MPASNKNTSTSILRDYREGESGMTVNDSYDFFVRNIEEVVEKNIPLKTSNSKRGKRNGLTRKV